MSDYTKTQRVLCLIRALITSPNNMINDITFRSIMGDPSKANYHKLITELTSDQGEIQALLTRDGTEEDYQYTMNEHYSGFSAANAQSEFVLECYSRLGSVLPEEMQKRLSKVINQKNNKTKNLSRKFCHVTPIKGRELEDTQKEILSLITKSILEEKEIRITYKDSKDIVSTFLFKPLTLCQYREDLYLLGHELTNKEFVDRNCKIRRIQKVEATENKFSYPSNKNWDPHGKFRINSGIIDKMSERFDVQIKVFGTSRVMFKDKVIFNNKLITNEADFDLYEVTCTGINEFLGQLFVYAQDIEIVDNEHIKKLFVEKAMAAVGRNQKLKKVA
jgi:predicted DNA-binding transcriptional regulator YafY